MSTPELTVFDHPMSSYAQKVRLALREKKLPYKSVMGLSPAVAEEFERANPRKEVPCLVRGDLSIFDSTIILEYLEDAFPETTHLYPPVSDPGARAKVREIEDIIDTQYEAVNWVWGECIFMDRAGEQPKEGEKGTPLYEHLKSEVQRQIGELNKWLEARLQSGEGGALYFGGKHGFTVADIAVWTVLTRAVWYGFPPEKGSKLATWLEQVGQRESVKATKKEFDENLGMMSLPKAAIKSGEKQRQYRDYRLEVMIRSGGLSIVEQGFKDKNIKFVWPNGKLFE